MDIAYKQQYLPAENVWLLSAPEAPFEIVVGGNSSSPSEDRLKMLSAIGARSADLVERAKAYLDEFVDRRTFSEGGEWFFEGLELGRNREEPADEFQCLFSVDGDTYGLWYVTYKRTAESYFPVKLLRRQE